MVAIEFLNSICVAAADQFCSALPTESVDCICTDPPYGIQYDAGNWPMNNGRTPRKTRRTFGGDFFYDIWIQHAYYALKHGGAIYLFTQWQVMERWRQSLELAGFTVRMPIYWDKLHWGAGNLEVYGNQVEIILFATKGDHRIRWQKREGNVWRLTKLDSINNEGNYDNPTQKPERLIERIISRATDKGDIVLDPFMGSGTTAVVARYMGRQFLGCDIAPDQVAIANERLALPFTLKMM